MYPNDFGDFLTLPLGSRAGLIICVLSEMSLTIAQIGADIHVPFE